MSNLIVSAVAKWNGAALKKGQKDLTEFQKTTNNLAKTFASVFAAQKIYAFGKASVKAFMADEKAAKSLEIALQNTGNGFATIATEGFISRMQQTYRVLDDELRPAFQTLLTATGSITKAQEGLQLALDVSAGTTKDLASVSQALARGYAGNTQGLSRLNAGLDKAILKTGDMEQITAALTAKFQGQAIAALDTYAKKMDVLTIAAANSKEIIGKGLLDSIDALSGTNGITAAADAMEILSQNVADTLYGFTLLLAKVEKVSGFLTKSNGPGGLLAGAAAGALVGGLAGGPGGALVGAGLGLTAARAQQMTQNYGAKDRISKTPYSPTSQYFTVETAERAKNTAILKKNNATLTAAQKLAANELAAKNKALAEQAALDELKKKFDVGRINLETALANSKDEAEKARIRSLLTIMDDDAAAAGKRLAELDKANADKLRAEYLAAVSLNNLSEAARLAALGVSELKMGGAPISQFDKYKTDPTFIQAVVIEADMAAAEAEKAAADAATIAAGSEQTLADYFDYLKGLGVNVAQPAPIVANFDFSNSIGSEEMFTEATKRALQRLNRFGDSTNYAGAIG